MSEETLLTAARRLVRYLNIDLVKGGIVTIETQAALDTLDKMVRTEDKRRERANGVEIPDRPTCSH